MKRIFAYTQTIQTASNGIATVYFGQVVRGRVHMAVYTRGTIAANALFTLTGETTGSKILAEDATGTATTIVYYPKAIPNKNTDGATFTDAGSDCFIYGERAKLVLASGGGLRLGSMTIYVEEDH